MKRQITFKPLLREGYPPIDIVGEETAYGLVLHPAIGVEKHPAHWPTHYAVSDPVTGAQICSGSDRMDTISELIRLARRCMDEGGFKSRLERGRNSYSEPLLQHIYKRLYG